MKHVLFTPLKGPLLSPWRRALNVVLSVLLVGLGDGYHRASAERPSDGGDPTGSRARYDGETVFRGLFFGSGPVAKLLPEIWEHPDVKASVERAKSLNAGADTLKQWEDRVVQRLKSQDSSFLDRFGTEIQSGDHLRIQQALDQAGREIVDSVRAELGVSAEVGGRKPMLPLDVDMAIYRHTVVAVDAALVSHVAVAAQVAVAVIAVVVIVIFFAYQPHGGMSAASLEREMWIDMIAERLDKR